MNELSLPDETVINSEASPINPRHYELALAEQGLRRATGRYLTIEEILKGKQPEYPLHRRDATFKKAPRSRPDAAKNLSLPLLPGE